MRRRSASPTVIIPEREMPRGWPIRLGGAVVSGLVAGLVLARVLGPSAPAPKHGEGAGELHASSRSDGHGGAPTKALPDRERAGAERHAARDDSTEHAPQEAPPTKGAPTAPGTPTAAHEAPGGAAQDVQPPPEGPTPSPAAASAPSPAPAQPAPGPPSAGSGVASRARIEHGRVAYLRCTQAPPSPGDRPCPRERAIEDAVWAAIDALPQCAMAPAGPGEADLRVEMLPNAPPVPKLGPLRSPLGSLDGPSLLACMRPRIGALPPRTAPSPLVLAFRFSVTPR